MRIACVLLCVIAGFTASAREADGTLGILITPNDGIPALVLAGGTFEVVAKDDCLLRLVSDSGSLEVSAQWKDIPGGLKKATCTLPASVAQGTYSLSAHSDKRDDTNVRSVYVYDSFPDTYSFAHVARVQIGAIRNDHPAAELARSVFGAVNESNAAVAIVTGDLTDAGKLEEFTSLLEILDTCRIPTFVCPGERDGHSGAFEKVFGLTHYVRRFGKDGFLAIDAKDALPVDDLGTQSADLEVDRRAIKAARWSIGFTQRFSPDMGGHAQLALFVDDPLDLLLLSPSAREDLQAPKTVPWAGWPGATRISVAPAALDGKMRLFDVSATGLAPREAP